MPNASLEQESLEYHRKLQGKIEVTAKQKVEDMHSLSLAYTPGVAYVVKAIAARKELAYEYTMKANTIAIITDGSRVLGLGNVGPEAALPVMEGKALLFKEFGGVNAMPICLATQDVDEIVETVQRIAPNFGGINLEDIESPKCFEIEKRLAKSLDIPVFHDDQYGTAIIVLAGLTNALKLVGKSKEVKIVVNGAGAAGHAITSLLTETGFHNLVVCDSKGIISLERSDLDEYKRELAEKTRGTLGKLEDAAKDADVLIGVSQKDAFSKKLVHGLAKNSIVMALANPFPEISVEDAKVAGARIVCTGRSDYPNQINNAVCFPGFFKGLLQARAKKITLEMKLAAAHAIASHVGTRLADDCVVPEVFDKTLAPAVAKAVVKATHE